MDKTEIINLTEASGVSDNDYVMIDSPTLGVRKYSASNLQGGEPTLKTKSITANGTYEAINDNAQGYSEVTVNVPKAPDLILDKAEIIDNTKSTNTVPLNLPSEYDYYIISLQDINGYDTYTDLKLANASGYNHIFQGSNYSILLDTNGLTIQCVSGTYRTIKCTLSKVDSSQIIS